MTLSRRIPDSYSGLSVMRCLNRTVWNTRVVVPRKPRVWKVIDLTSGSYHSFGCMDSPVESAGQTVQQQQSISKKTRSVLETCSSTQVSRWNFHKRMRRREETNVTIMTISKTFETILKKLSCVRITRLFASDLKREDEKRWFWHSCQLLSNDSLRRRYVLTQERKFEDELEDDWRMKSSGRRWRMFELWEAWHDIRIDFSLESLTFHFSGCRFVTESVSGCSCQSHERSRQVFSRLSASL